MGDFKPDNTEETHYLIRHRSTGKHSSACGEINVKSRTDDTEEVTCSKCKQSTVYIQDSAIRHHAGAAWGYA